MTKPTPTIEKPTTPAPPDDAELHAHEQAGEDAGSSWKTIDEDELRQLEQRGYEPGLQPARAQPPTKPS